MFILVYRLVVFSHRTLIGIQRMLIVPNFINLSAFTEDGDVHVVVETPRGSRAKFAYDPKLETFSLTKSLLTGLTYPHDRGSCRRPRPMTATRSTSW